MPARRTLTRRTVGPPAPAEKTDSGPEGAIAPGSPTSSGAPSAPAENEDTTNPNEPSAANGAGGTGETDGTPASATTPTASAEANDRRGLPWRDLVSDLRTTFTAANPPGLAAEVAYSIVFALPSLMLMLVTIAVLADASTGSAISAAIESAIRRQAPAEMQPLLLSMVETASERAAATAPTVGAALSSLIALWIAGGGFAALAGACARAGGRPDTRPFLVRRALAAGSVLILVVMLIVSVFLFIFGEAIGRQIGQEFGGEETFARVWNALQEPLGLVVVTATLLFIYRVGAGVRRSWRWLLPGALLVAVLLFLLMRGFGLYLRLLDPGSAYGPAGSLVVLLFFVYASSFVIIAGAMLSAVLGRRYDSP